MRAAKFLLVSEDIAERAGVLDIRTRTEDGRYVLYEGDMKLVHLLPEEYVTGIQGIEVITEAQAQELVEAAKAAEPAPVNAVAEPGAEAETDDAEADETEENETDNNLEEDPDNGTDEPGE